MLQRIFAYTYPNLAEAPRRFLGFIVFNVVSWHSLMGPALVLFARTLNMPASWIGWLLAAMPLTMLLVIFTEPLVQRLGPKRLLLTTWFVRDCVACVIFLLPWAYHHGGEHWGWAILSAATVGFCVVRALGAGGWLPWVYEFVPEAQRALYFSAETAITQLVIVLVNLAHTIFLHGNPGLDRFIAIYAVGILAGFISLKHLEKVSGGEPMVMTAASPTAHTSWRHVLKDRAFLKFVLTISVGFMALTWFGASVILFLRDGLRMSPNTIMFLMVVGSLSIFLMIRASVGLAERRRVEITLAVMLVLHACAVAVFLFFQRYHPLLLLVFAPLVAVTNISGASFSVLAHRVMLERISSAWRVSYTLVWTVATSLGLGLTPILAGWVIQQGGAWGYRACFILSILGCFGTAAFLLLSRGMLATVYIPPGQAETSGKGG